MVSGGEGVTFLKAVDSEQWPLGRKNKSKNLPVPVEAAVMEWVEPSKGRRRGGGRELEFIGKKVSGGGEREMAMK